MSRAPQGGTASNLRLRVLSALVLIVVALAATWLGGIVFSLFCAAIAGAIYYEWTTMTARDDARVLQLVCAAALFVVLAMLVLGAPAHWLLGVLIASALAAGIAGKLRGTGSLWPAAGLLYAGLSGLSLALLRGGEISGLLAVIFLFAVVWATDILAYFVGRAVGGPKLAPAISPGKTWSGALGGTAAGVLAGALAWLALFGSTGLAGMAVLALALSVAAQVGDLGESALKRRFSVKDSSGLIPGHGGVMDRVDGLVAAALLLYLAGAATGGFDTPSALLFSARG